MTNLTKFSTVVLAGYIDTGNTAYFYFAVILLLYGSIIFANVLVISAICVNSTLHEPMYLFVCNLCVNELYGTTSLFPCLLVNVISDSHEISLVYCYLQMYCMYTYATAEFCHLSVMSYDRYTSICHPLQYNTIMTQRKVCILLALAWSSSFCQFTITLSLNVQLELCGNVIQKVWCDNYLLVRQACSDTTMNSIFGLYTTVLFIGGPLLIILYSYIRVISVTFRASREAKRKSLSTCGPHLVSLLNYGICCSFEMIQSRLGKANMPDVLRVIISLYFLMIPPLFNPVMYGLKMPMIRQGCLEIMKMTEKKTPL
ncbi:olfactory receptor 11A1-like [Engraulis encrasicolus]|uniref:olfactory receptor 11A1-like n=1 Tax=Engraulis encrasicolus TaxID=184585 RepID=UPI002FD37891